jgi:hypothetical protein
LLAKDVALAGEMALPKQIAEHGDGLDSRLVAGIFW